VELAENSEVTVEEIYQGFARLRVTRGFVRFSALGQRAFTPASETGVMLGTKGTDYGLAYNPENQITSVEIYDGTIEIIDESSEKILATLTTTYGNEIKRAEVTKDKNVEQKIAIPGSEWEAFSKSQAKPTAEEQQGISKTGKGVWMFILLIIFLGGGFWLYKKGLLKKILPPKLKP
jgi:hypothetical protein